MIKFNDTFLTHFPSQDCSLEEVKKLFLEQLQPISEKNLLQILAGETSGRFGTFFIAAFRSVCVESNITLQTKHSPEAVVYVSGQVVTSENGNENTKGTLESQ